MPVVLSKPSIPMHPEGGVVYPHTLGSAGNYRAALVPEQKDAEGNWHPRNTASQTRRDADPNDNQIQHLRMHGTPPNLQLAADLPQRQYEEGVVWVGNLHPLILEDILRTKFSQYGAVSRVNIILSPLQPASFTRIVPVHAYVTLGSPEAAQQAEAEDLSTVAGFSMRVQRKLHTNEYPDMLSADATDRQREADFRIALAYYLRPTNGATVDQFGLHNLHPHRLEEL